MISEGMYSSKDDEWGVPRRIFMGLDDEFDFTLDPCGNKKRRLKGDMVTWDKEDNGLQKSWINHRVFVNPPYSQINSWVKKCYAERNNVGVIVLLIFSRTDTKYFHEYIYNIAELRFIRGRIKFVDITGIKPKNTAPFPSMLAIFRGDGERNDLDKQECSKNYPIKETTTEVPTKETGPILKKKKED